MRDSTRPEIHIPLESPVILANRRESRRTWPWERNNGLYSDSMPGIGAVFQGIGEVVPGEGIMALYVWDYADEVQLMSHFRNEMPGLIPYGHRHVKGG